MEIPEDRLARVVDILADVQRHAELSGDLYTLQFVTNALEVLLPDDDDD